MSSTVTSSAAPWLPHRAFLRRHSVRFAGESRYGGTRTKPVHARMPLPRDVPPRPAWRRSRKLFGWVGSDRVWAQRGASQRSFPAPAPTWCVVIDPHLPAKRGRIAYESNQRRTLGVVSTLQESTHGFWRPVFVSIAGAVAAGAMTHTQCSVSFCVWAS